ncbi:hypothetical protein M0Q28_06200 [Patescibacteria group bacterium]|jgi:hypothetical protein|nr:hypothetical protein [Patescibacteria group bacterium]
MPITTAKYTDLLFAGHDCLAVLRQLAEVAQQSAIEMKQRPDDSQFILARLIATIGSSKPDRQSQITIEKEMQIYTPAKIARNTRMREYMRQRGGHLPFIPAGTAGTVPSPSPDTTETEDERNARISREEDERLDRMNNNRLDISDPPNAHLPLPKPQTAAEILASLRKQIPPTDPTAVRRGAGMTTILSLEAQEWIKNNPNSIPESPDDPAESPNETQSPNEVP